MTRPGFEDLSPEAQRVVNLSRRTFLRGVGASGAVVAGSGLLAACGTSGTKKSTSEQAATDLSAKEKVVNWSNWPEYIDVDDKNQNLRPSVEQFTKKTGIKVKYTEDINDNDQFFGKIRPQLAGGQDTGRDLIVLTDWMAGKLIRLNWVQKLDKANIPNWTNLTASLKNVPFDDGRVYSLPWQSGFTGIGYNKKATGKEIKSIDQLLTDPDLKGRVTMLTEMRDTMGLVLLSMGKDTVKFTDDDFMSAIDRLQKAVDSGQIRKFTGNEYTKDLNKGDIAACTAWSGDVIQLQFANSDVKFAPPESGQMLWSDNMLVPNKAKHMKNAEQVMNFYYDPKIAAEVAAWVNYICPVTGAKEQMAKIDKSLVNNSLIFPDDQQLSVSHPFKDLDEKTEKKYNDAFQAVIGA